MRILFLSPDVPNFPMNGGDLRLHNVLGSILEEHRVVFAAFCRGERLEPGWSLTRELEIPPVLVRAKVGRAQETPASHRLRFGFSRPLLGLPLRSDRWDSPPFWELLTTLDLEDFDAVHVMHQTMGLYGLALKVRFPHLRLTVDVDNILSVMRGRELRKSNLPLYSRWRWRSQIDVWQLRLWERRVWRECDSIWLCSEMDRQFVPRALRDRAAVIPNGVDCASYRDLAPPDDSPRLIFVGDMGYHLNEQAVCYFARAVLPLIHQQVPDAEFWIVGRNPPPAVRQMENEGRRIRVTGTVPDVRPFLGRSAVSVVPLLGGGGTRLKILEAMASGLPVVSTAIGAEGLEVDQAIFLADTPRHFADSCIRLLRQPDLRRSLGEAGRRFARETFDWGAVRQRVKEVYAALAPRSLTCVPG